MLAPLTNKVVGMRGGEDTKHYVTPAGVSSIVKHYMKQANISPRQVKMVMVSKYSDSYSVLVLLFGQG